MATDLTHINAALTRIGEPPIAGLDEGSPAATIAAANYDRIVAAELGAYRWRWATKTEQLNALSGTPNPPWAQAYQRPADLILLRSIESRGRPIRFEIQSDKVLTDDHQGVAVIARYVWRAPESLWMASFAEAITQRLEALFLRGIGERYNEAEARNGSADVAFRSARLLDAQTSSPINPERSATLEARRA